MTREVMSAICSVAGKAKHIANQLVKSARGDNECLPRDDGNDTPEQSQGPSIDGDLVALSLTCSL